MGGNDRGPTEIKIPANGYWNYFVSLEAIGWTYCRSFMGEQGLPMLRAIDLAANVSCG